MPLSQAQPRKPIHQRIVSLNGYERDDGLWDIEAHLVDTKSYVFPNAYRGDIPPGEPLHEMWIRATFDDSLTLKDIEAVSDATPFAVCPDIVDQFKQLIGIQVGPGWRRGIMERVGGVKGCTHLVEMMQPIATAAVQTILSILARRRREQGIEATTQPMHLDTCHALKIDGEVVKEHYPKWYKP